MTLACQRKKTSSPPFEDQHEDVESIGRGAKLPIQLISSYCDHQRKQFEVLTDAAIAW